MDEVADLRHMLLSFRVSELQSLLVFAGRSKTGRKHELMGRALQMLKSEGNHHVRKKLRELYERRCPRKMVLPPAPPRPPIPPPVQRSPQLPSVNSDTTGVPVHPDVRLSHLPFFEQIDDLVRPTSLVLRSELSHFQEAYVMFHLTPSQVQLISSSRDTRPNSRNEYTVQVQLRFCLFETSCVQEDNFPSSLCVKVNGKMCQINTGHTSQNCNPNAESKRPSKPVNITPLCRLSSTVPNHIHVTWTPKFGQRHVVTVKLVQAVTSSCLIQRLKNNGYRNPDHSRALIKEKLAHDPESEVATTSLRVSLLCPLGKTRMTLPCRAITCNHLQCFDAALYLQMNERKTTWICPVCDKKAPFDKLVLDGLFREILEAAVNCNEISFHEDGSWRPINDLQEHESKKAISALISSAVVSTPEKGVSASKLHLQGETKEVDNKKDKEFEVIDLTLDSDSESEKDTKDNDDDEESDNDRDLNTPRPPYGVISTAPGPGGVKAPPGLNPMVLTNSTSTIPGTSTSALLNPNFFSPLDFPCPALDLDSMYPLFSPNETYPMYHQLLGPHGSSNVIQLD
ncbi:E3 SUMO-protein ligase PIAS3-like [Stylophora pistillata]|uniref:E3 SUMO-protein ligase PIAS3 n=1 Tax=Stylophora pistillata TaxID=50429 RepID=A0A2B4SQQ8_STYPI|nr:E3 SUMO-protein ligase PIAS3-like [Stylophora pistillata]PFX30938.1 E3 SUMO-protein ligase PIAS3 [Stylophora pistillata]